MSFTMSELKMLYFHFVILTILVELEYEYESPNHDLQIART